MSIRKMADVPQIASQTRWTGFSTFGTEAFCRTGLAEGRRYEELDVLVERLEMHLAGC